jgi:hypothetical protein
VDYICERQEVRGKFFVPDEVPREREQRWMLDFVCFLRTNYANRTHVRRAGYNLWTLTIYGQPQRA